MRLAKRNSSVDKCIFEVVSIMRSHLLVMLLLAISCRVTSDCDSSNPIIDEGNIGQAATFPWLGILRVYLPGEPGDKPEIALTGLVLIKKTYALASADDVKKIPKRIFDENTHAMFMVAPDTPWYVRPKSYRIHNEYETTTINTIAVLQLDLENDVHNPLRPICWSHRISYRSSLYLTGFTDENNILEKVIHKMQYADKKVCNDFESLAELTEAKRTPAHYLCGFSTSKTQCVWENGMVLVSNSSKHFTLVGFAISSPGCTAPARFIDLRHYYKWVEDVTTTKDVQGDYRRLKGDEIHDNQGIHKYFFFNEFTNMEVPSPFPMKHEEYTFDTIKPGYFNVDKLDDHTLMVFPFNGSQEVYDKACSRWNVLIYKDILELKAQFSSYGHAFYKVSLYDLQKRACGCVRINIESVWRSPAVLSYKEFLEVGEGTATKSSEETPDELKRIFPINDRTLPTTESTNWRPGKHLGVEFLREDRGKIRVLNYDLYVHFGFHNQAILTIEMFADALPPTSTTTELARRMFDFPGLTSKEERLEYLKQKRMKMTRPAGRKMWYDEAAKNRSVRSRIVTSVPETVAEYFGSDSDTPINNVYDVHVSKVDSLEDDTEPALKIKYLKFIQTTAKPRQVRFEAKHGTGKASHTLMHTTSIPEFTIKAIRAMSSAPKKIDHIETKTVTPSKSSTVAPRLPLDKVICLSIISLIVIL